MKRMNPGKTLMKQLLVIGVGTDLLGRFPKRVFGKTSKTLMNLLEPIKIQKRRISSSRESSDPALEPSSYL